MEDLARESGVHLATVREIEGGKDRRVQARVRRALSTALGLNPSDLFNEEGRAKSCEAPLTPEEKAKIIGEMQESFRKIAEPEPNKGSGGRE